MKVLGLGLGLLIAVILVVWTISGDEGLSESHSRGENDSFGFRDLLQLEDPLSGEDEETGLIEDQKIVIKNTTSGIVGGVSFFHDGSLGSAHAWLSEHVLEIYPDGVARQSRGEVDGYEALYVFGGDGSLLVAISRGDSVLVLNAPTETEMRVVIAALVLQ